MTDVDLTALSHTVVWLTFALAFVFGAVLQRTHFCTMGALSDIVNIGDWNRMRMWWLAIGVATIGTGILASQGIIDPVKAIYTTPRFTWLSYIVGGWLFGFGMVLASGCGSKTLVRIGGGNLKSLLVFTMIGLSAYMTLKGVFAVLRVTAIDSVQTTFATSQDLPTLLGGMFGGDIQRAQLVLGLVIGGAFVIAALARREFWTFDNLLGGLVVGAIIVALWYVSGKVGYVAENPNTLEESFVATNSGKMEALSFVSPLAYTLYWLMMWSDTSNIITLGIASVLGVIAGSFVYALVSRNFRWEGFQGTEDTANHMAGGMLMGFGGVTALGCTVGQGLSGVSTLALGSFVAIAAILAGGVCAFKYQMWRIERSV
ncbi:transporter [Pandoraea apista]|uniref:YeeE/YedE family protein n=1 Tax=Pandoraea apista TaxID=93218 RepID=UPI000CE9965C|nr:YeeE/YedE family protein [Pandoraea apista]AVF40218.1 transporter [Pandoraea apista]